MMSADEPDLLDVLEEQEKGPLPCPHSVNMKNGGWVQEWDPKRPYYAEWVHAHPHCRRSKFPGHKQPMPTVGWSVELQKDVPLCELDVEEPYIPMRKPTTKAPGRSDTKR